MAPKKITPCGEYTTDEKTLNANVAAIKTSIIFERQNPEPFQVFALTPENIARVTVLGWPGFAPWTEEQRTIEYEVAMDSETDLHDVYFFARIAPGNIFSISFVVILPKTFKKQEENN